MLSTDDNAGRWGNDWPVESVADPSVGVEPDTNWPVETAADPSTGVESANDWSVEPGTKEDEEW